MVISIAVFERVCETPAMQRDIAPAGEAKVNAMRSPKSAAKW